MSVLRHKSLAVVYGLLALLLAAACIVSILTGSVRLGAMTAGVLRFGLRVLMASVAGAGLSVAGVVFQSLLRNPLAEPYVLGVTAGAGLGAALAIATGITVLGLWTVPGMAFAGALGTILLVQALARALSGAAPVETMLLAGITISAVLNSLLMFVVSVAPSDKLHGVVWWLLGNLQVFEWRLLAIVAVVVAAGLAVAILWARDLNLMALGDESAAHLGLNVTAQPPHVLRRGLACHRGHGCVLRDHRLRRADRAACRALDRRAGPPPSGACGRAGRRCVSGAGRLPRPDAARARRNSHRRGHRLVRRAIVPNTLAQAQGGHRELMLPSFFGRGAG